VLAQDDEEEGSYLSTQPPGRPDRLRRAAAHRCGTWFLREAVAADPAMADVSREQIRELPPAVAESISPPSEGAWDVLRSRRARWRNSPSPRSTGASR
jgi:hypothetical protein